MKRLLFVAGFVIVVVIGGVLMGLHHRGAGLRDASNSVAAPRHEWDAPTSTGACSFHQIMVATPAIAAIKTANIGTDPRMLSTPPEPIHVESGGASPLAQEQDKPEFRGEALPSDGALSPFRGRAAGIEAVGFVRTFSWRAPIGDEHKLAIRMWEGPTEMSHLRGGVRRRLAR